MKKFIPNAITLSNLLCGCIAVIYTLQGDLAIAAVFVVLGLFLDFFDGFAARLLKVQSPIGKELDSLADVVTFGVVPALFMMKMLSNAVHYKRVEMFTEDVLGLISFEDSYIPYIGLLIALASAYRLAKFNVDTRQTDSFIGLPSPANALWIISLPMILLFQPSELASALLLNEWVLIALTLLSCYLLNAEIPLFSLKFKTFDFKSNSVRYVFLLMSLLLISLLQFIAVPLIILLYIVLSLITARKSVA